MSVLAATVGLLLVSPVLASAQADPEIADFFQRLSRGFAAIGASTGAEASSRCTAFFQSTFDVDRFIRAASAEIGEGMAADQRRRAYAAIEARVRKNCEKENAAAPGNSLSFVGVRSTDGGVRLLATQVQSRDGSPGRVLVWRIQQEGKGGPLRAIDLLVDGRSAQITLRDEIRAIVERHKGDLDAVLRALEN